ncbi:MAG: HdeA/HdeB family chaperone [Sphingomicrobium sp.]
MRQWIGLATLLWAVPGEAEQTLFAPMRNGAQFVCADLNELGASSTDAIGYWILGFWSGLNGANDALVGDTTTANGVVGEVKLYCAAHPSVGLAQATLDTYAAMKKVRKR